MVLFPHLLLALSVLALLLVGYESQIRRSRRVSVSPASEGRQLRLDSDPIVLERGAFAMARKTEALKFLLLTPEGGADGDDVIELLYFSQEAHRALVVLQLPDLFFFGQGEAVSRGPEESLEDLKGEVWEAFPLPRDRDAREVFQPLKPGQDLLGFLVEVFDGAGARGAV